MSTHLAKSRSSEAGFTLVEVIVSALLLSVLSVGVAQLAARSSASNFKARQQTSTTLLSIQKMEQLRGLEWGYDAQEAALGLPSSDTTTDISVDPPTALGSGLNPSPAGAIDGNTARYVDFLNEHGEWVSNDTTPPAGARYVRRWSIEPLPTNPNNVLILQVVTRALVGTGAAPVTETPLGESRLVSVKARKAS